MSSPGLRPLRVGEILDAAIKVYIGNARVLMGLTATIVVPLQILSGIVLLSTVSSGSDVPVGFSGVSAQSTTDQAARLGALAVLEVTSVIALVFTTAACVKAVSDSYLGQPPAIGTSLRFAVRRLLPLVAMDILLFLGLILGFIALIVPFVWLYVSWSIASPVLLIDRVGPARALRRSVGLVRGRWWPTAGVLVVATVMGGVIAGALEALLAAISLHSHPSVLLATTVVSLATAVSTIITKPFQAAVATVLYYDLRVRREGYDLQLLAEQLGLPARSADSDPAGGLSGDWSEPLGPESVGQPGGPPFWPPPPGWRPAP